ncbi:MAG: metallophosphoesterase [Cyanothece sp. SIO1E1]|nr:metallophosphoesterase [Cyanothece sp. SIO1E1]
MPKKRHRSFTKTIQQWARRIVLLGIGVAICSWIYAFKIEPAWIEVVPIALTLPHLPSAFQDFKIVQISDLHAGGAMTEQRLTRIMTLVNQQQPDLIAITGDFVTRDPQQFAPLLEKSLQQLTPNALTVAVLGNHDHWQNPHIIREVLAKSSILDLSNAVYTLQRGQDQLNIAGIDDFWFKKARLEQVMAQLPLEGAAILLAHEPDFADISTRERRFDLQLSGHSHGGQVRLPFIGPPILPPYGKKYPMGRYQVGDMILYTNRGVGMVSPEVRLSCRPEITVLTLKTTSPVTS